MNPQINVHLWNVEKAPSSENMCSDVFYIFSSSTWAIIFVVGFEKEEIDVLLPRTKKDSVVSEKPRLSGPSNTTDNIRFVPKGFKCFLN